jgi:type II secretory pathway component PulK
MTMRNQSGFSTILALLLTGFLVTLAAGVLFLFLSENRTNQSLLTGTAAYHAAEGGIEYALLKIKNHREGFADALVLGGKPGAEVVDYEGNRIGEDR